MASHRNHGRLNGTGKAASVWIVQVSLRRQK